MSEYVTSNIFGEFETYRWRSRCFQTVSFRFPMLNLIDILSSCSLIKAIFDLEIKHALWVFLIVKCKSSGHRSNVDMKYSVESSSTFVSESENGLSDSKHVSYISISVPFFQRQFHAVSGLWSHFLTELRRATSIIRLKLMLTTAQSWRKRSMHEVSFMLCFRSLFPPLGARTRSSFA